jgi:hypothetical protein
VEASGSVVPAEIGETVLADDAAGRSPDALGDGGWWRLGVLPHTVGCIDGNGDEWEVQGSRRRRFRVELLSQRREFPDAAADFHANQSTFVADLEPGEAGLQHHLRRAGGLTAGTINNHLWLCPPLLFRRRSSPPGVSFARPIRPTCARTVSSL